MAHNVPKTNQVILSTIRTVSCRRERGMTQLVASADTVERDRLGDSLPTMVWYTLYGGQS